MRTVNEVSKLTGVSVRTLHHYDAIGLLKPTEVTDAGYRLYDNAALDRLQTILLFRELQFPLKEIKEIIESQNFDREKALEQQINLLELRRKHLGKLISFAREILNTGVNNMDFSAFDKTELNQYTAEAKRKWGSTEAYKEYEQKASNQTDADQKTNAENLMRIFSEIGEMKNLSHESSEVQSAVEKLRQFVTDHYYNCTPQIFRGLGQMYAEDERFRNNINSYGGEGTAEFASMAIAYYCDNVEI